MKYSKKYLNQEQKSDNRDPINRWFFKKPGELESKGLDDYFAIKFTDKQIAAEEEFEEIEEEEEEETKTNSKSENKKSLLGEISGKKKGAEV